MSYPYTRTVTRNWGADSVTNVAGSASQPRFHLSVSGVKRSKGDPFPPTLPTPYYKYVGVATKVIPSPHYIGTYPPSVLDGLNAPLTNGGGYGPNGIACLNKAYEKLIQKVHGDTASLAVNLLEAGQVPGMFSGVAQGVRNAATRITKSATRMARAYRYLRKGDLPRCVNVLGVPMRPRDAKRHRRARTPRQKQDLTRRTAHEASSIWLQYHFGWSPLASDVYNGVTVLCSDRWGGWTPLWGSASSPGSVTTQIGGSYDAYSRGVTVDFRETGRVQWMVRINNPNFARNTSLGLNNPQTWLWELIPFSFVVDWFTNVSQVLDSYTDLWGYDVDSPFYSYYLRGKVRAWCGNWGAHQCLTEYSIYRTERTLAQYKPVLLRPSILRFGHSIKRAATAVSLLVALFIGR